MARTNEVMQFTVNLKGAKDAKGELSAIINAAQNADRASEKVKKSASDALTGGGGGKDGPGFLRGAAQVAIGNLIGGSLSKGFSAFSTALNSAFDANLTRTERDVAGIQAGLSAIPFVGQPAANLFGTGFQVETGTAQGVASRLNSAFGSAFQAFGAANPGLEGEALEKALQARFGDEIQRARDFFLPQERAREIGSKLISDLDPGLSGKDFENASERALTNLSKDLERLFGVTIEELKTVFSGQIIVDAINSGLEGVSEGLDALGESFEEGFEKLKGYFGIGDQGG